MKLTRRTLETLLLSGLMALGGLVAPDPAAAQENSLRTRAVASTSGEPAVERTATAEESSPTRSTKTRSKTVARRSSSPTRLAAHRRSTAVHSPRGYVPRHLQQSGIPIMQGDPAEEIPEGAIIIEGDGMPEVMPEELMMDGMPLDGCADGPCSGGCGDEGCRQCCLLPCPVIAWDRFELFTGTHGFTGPANRGQSGSFGFHEGLNYGAPLPCVLPGWIGMQLGAQVTHSNYSGSSFTDEERTQVFVTGGLFRRVDWGLQGGVVVDYLHDEWYYDIDPIQIRGELSWIYPQNHELGFWFTSGVQDVTAPSTFRDTAGQTQTVTETWTPTDLYAFFYRHRVDNLGGGEGRFFAGFSGESDGLIGSELNLPVADSFAVQTSAVYLIPEERNDNGFAEESWNVSINAVWYPGCRTRKRDYYRPLFNVANNGTFMLDRQ